jgi:hypothetical protein
LAYRHTLLIVERTNYEAVVALLFLTALHAVPDSSLGTFSTVSRSNLIVALVAGAGNSIEVAVLRACGNWRLNWPAISIGHEISSFTNTFNSIPVCINGTAGYELARSHDILAPRDANTFLLSVIIYFILTA